MMGKLFESEKPSGRWKRWMAIEAVSDSDSASFGLYHHHEILME
jgi:hypothetical protein